MSHEHRIRIAERIRRIETPAGSWFVLNTPVDEVVSIHGSIETAPDFDSGQEIVQELMVSMLDKGTHEMSKRELAEFLEDRGASTSFSSEGVRIRMSARCLREDLADVLPVLLDQLGKPAFNEDEFERVRRRLAANMASQITRTGTRASALLSRRLYLPSHPNYRREIESELRALESVTIDQIRQYHSEMVAANNLKLILVGDISGDVEAVSVDHLEKGWTNRPDDAGFMSGDDRLEPDREHYEIPDRPNLDVRLGHRLDILRLHDDFLPLYVGVYALGGNFSSRLMSVVRDEKGLTYGIRSILSGVDQYYTGHWSTSVTLSKDRIEEGLAVTTGVIREFLETGVTDAQLETLKTTLTGSYEVRLETTRGIASTVLSHLERGHGIERTDRLPEQINALSTAQVNRALLDYLDADRLHVCSAGTLEM